jgi:hypothetical protein
MTEKSKSGEMWRRLAKNRSFVGEFIANPEATLVRYDVKVTESDFLALCEMADKLFAHASATLQSEDTRLLTCGNVCPLNCSE